MLSKKTHRNNSFSASKRRTNRRKLHEKMNRYELKWRESQTDFIFYGKLCLELYSDFHRLLTSKS